MAHKIITGFVVIVLIGGGYWTYKTVKAANVVPQYMVALAHTGMIQQTVTGTGQVSAENQLDVTSKVSGEIQAINVSVGQRVTTGQLLATIDPGNAASDLQSARISYDKLIEPPKEADVTNAENNLTKAYTDGFNNASNLFLDLPSVMAGLKDTFYDQNGFLSSSNTQQNVILLSGVQAYITPAESSFDKASIQYTTLLDEYKSLTRSSATSSIDQLLDDSAQLAKNVATVLQNTQNTVTYIIATQPQYQISNQKTAAANVNTWSTTINSDLSNITNSQNTITTNINSISTLTEGPDSLDIQSQQISLQQKQDAYADYFIRAPFAGIVGRIPVKKYDQAGGSTIIATIVGDQKIATISLNEVDAAKVAVGQPVTITFDAIDGLTATGTVSQVDLVGAVTQGVVSYGVKIAINTVDDRIKPGMSLNTTIITEQKPNVLVVPSAAVKTQGNIHYVQILSATGMASSTRTGAAGAAGGYGGAGGSGNGGGRGRFGTTTPSTASSTRTFGGGGFAGASAQFTVSSAIAPRQQIVTVGDSDDTNTEIVSGLTPGQAVVVRTVTTSATSAATPSILNALGGRGAAGAGGARPAGGGAGAGRTGGAAAGNVRIGG